MKKALLYIVIGLCAMTMKAQVFNPSVKMSESFSATDPGVLATIAFDANFVVNDHFSVGPGSGLGYTIFIYERFGNKHDKYEGAFTIPLYLQAKYFIMPKRKVSPYIHARTGYSFCIQGGYDNWLDWIDDYYYSNDVINGTGFDMSFGPGIDIALNRGSLQVSLDWNMMKTKYCSRDHYTSETMFGISVGYSWGRRR